MLNLLNKILLSVLIAGIVSQGLKILILILKHKQRFHWKDLILTGNMPSAHSALVSSLVLILFLEEGPSTSFVIAFVLAAIVIVDAFGVRRSVGDEGKLLNKIIKASKLHLRKLHYSLGHTPLEVTIGIIIGLASSLIVYYLL